MKAIAVIGYHHTGKTTTVVNLVKELSARGYRVATIKDIHSDKFRADEPGKNSALHIEAGSLQTVARGLHDTKMVFPAPLSLNAILPHLEADFLVIEGMKDAPVPKLVCAVSAEQIAELVDETAIGISGIISSEGYTDPRLPVYNAIEDISGLCDYVIAKSFKMLPAADPKCCSRCGTTCYEMAAGIVQGTRKREDCVLDSANSIYLKVGGKEIQIVPFVQDILRDSIMAVLKNLRDIPDGGEIEIRIGR